MKSLTVLALLLAALALPACGGGGGESSTAATASPSSQGAAAADSDSSSSSNSPPKPQGAAAEPPKQQRPKAVPGDTSAEFTPPTHHDSGGGSAQFERKGADNSIQESGSQAGGGELAQAAAALHGYLDARAAGAWSAACSYMAPGLTDSLAQLAGASGSGAKPSCPQLLATLSTGLPPSALREAAIADVGDLRVKGKSAFLLFKGAPGSAYFMPMARAGGEWKVAAIAASALP